MNRRDLFKTAGGLSLALTAGTLLDPRRALGRGDATLPTVPLRGGEPLPLFTALPYLQPGAGAARLPRTGETGGMVIAWQTNREPADFSLECNGTLARITRTERFQGDKADGEGVFNYAATVTGLEPGRSYPYRLQLDKGTAFKSTLAGRKGRGQRTRFVAFGDNSYGEISDKMTAHQAFRARPDFVMNTGDNVYEGGLDNEYARYFFPVYNAPVSDPRAGSPLIRSVPYYSVIANHDVHDKAADKSPVADFDKNPDSLAYFTNFHLPLNGPKQLARPVPISGKDESVAIFKNAAGNRFPSQANYSFDSGDGHFLCLDSNIYVDPTDAGLQAWIAEDLAETDAAWKFVVYHHPAYNAGDDHYTEQHMRVLSPLFEKHDVTVVLHGHEHNYQRTRPFRFAPKDESAARNNLGSKNRLVPGTFTVDRAFDGLTKTKPDGVTYVTTGAGGKHLYDTDWNRRPDLWRHKEDDNADYIAAWVSDRHSLTVFDMDAKSLVLTQVDQWGSTLDKVTFTK